MHNNYNNICTHLEVGKTALVHSLCLAGLSQVHAQGGIHVYTKAIVPIVLSYMYTVMQ